MYRLVMMCFIIFTSMSEKLRFSYGCGTAFRKQKGKQKELEKGFRRIAASTLREAKKRRLLWRSLDVAIDFNGLPWYGKLLAFIAITAIKR